jgi:hypothetical protein
LIKHFVSKLWRWDGGRKEEEDGLPTFLVRSCPITNLSKAWQIYRGVGSSLLIVDPPQFFREPKHPPPPPPTAFPVLGCRRIKLVLGRKGGFGGITTTVTTIIQKGHSFVRSFIHQRQTHTHLLN